VNVDGPGTVQHFMLSYILEKNGMSIQDVIRVTLGAQPAAQAFVAGQGDAAITYEPYLSTVRAKPDAGKILVTSKEYPVVVDVLVFKKDFIEKNPKIVKATGPASAWGSFMLTSSQIFAPNSRFFNCCRG